MGRMEYGEFKNLGYPDDLPMEYALVQALLAGKINILEVNNAYSMALEKERHLKRFLLFQFLQGFAGMVRPCFFCCRRTRIHARAGKSDKNFFMLKNGNRSACKAVFAKFSTIRLKFV